MTSFDLKHPPYSGQTSAARSALASQPSNQGSLLGWRGSNNVNLNVAFLARNLDMQPKTTLSETSQVAPALALFQNRWTIAWVGDNDERSINVAAIGFDADGSHAHIVNKQRHGSSEFSPVLASSGDALYLSWAGRDGDHTINVARSTDGFNFVGFPKWSGHSTFHAPGLAFNGGRGVLAYVNLNGRLVLVEIEDLANPRPSFVNELNETSSMDVSVTAWGDRFGIAWTGDGGHNLNVAEYDMSPSPSFLKDVFDDTSVFGPSLSKRRLVQDPHSNIPDTEQLTIAWVGSDGLNTLNAAVVRSRNAARS
jgi:hypothetical protein